MQSTSKRKSDIYPGERPLELYKCPLPVLLRYVTCQSSLFNNTDTNAEHVGESNPAQSTPSMEHIPQCGSLGLFPERWHPFHGGDATATALCCPTFQGLTLTTPPPPPPRAAKVCMLIFLIPDLISCQSNKLKDTEQKKRELHLPSGSTYGRVFGGTADGSLFSSRVNLRTVNSEPLVVSQRYTNTNTVVHNGHDYAAPTISAGNLGNTAITTGSLGGYAGSAHSAGSVGGSVYQSQTGGSYGGYAAPVFGGGSGGGYAASNLGAGSGGFIPSRYTGQDLMEAQTLKLVIDQATVMDQEMVTELETVTNQVTNNDLNLTIVQL
ncbi:hypothetical protein CBL_04974 [Carabus blaptoides fortunei]